jgi:regulator of protease activity HflC (stomatin/prohibitin superfamily)
MDSRNEKLCWLAAVLAAACLLLAPILQTRTHLLLLPALLPFYAYALLTAILVAVRLRLARLAADEQRDLELLDKESAHGALFAAAPGEAAPMVQARSREQFERWFVPAVAPLIALGFGVWAWQLAQRFALPATPPAQPLIVAAFLAGEAFLLFLLSRFLVGLGRAEPGRLLRGPAFALGLASYANLAGVIGAACVEGEIRAADKIATVILLALLGLVALELALRAIATFYRGPGRVGPLVAYESRLAGLLADPASWTQNIAGALDYQFGFQVSETWLYRFLRRALLPLVLLNLVVLYVSTCIVTLGPDEEGILEHFGQPKTDGWRLASGAHFKLPWPFETVRRYPTKRILALNIGYHEEPGAPHEKLILWTTPHFESEEQYLVASRADASATNRAAGTEASVPVNLVVINMPVEYQITNLFSYAYEQADPQQAMEQLAGAALTQELAARDLFDLLGPDRAVVAGALKARMQQAADRQRLGVEIVFVGLAGVHPPLGVAAAFESVVGATEEREASILAAQGYRNSTVPLASANAARIGAESVAYRVRRAELAQAEAQQFTRRLEASLRAPGVFRSRAYFDTLGDALAGIRKYIIAAESGHDVVIFNLEEKLNLDWMNLGGPPPEKKEKPK